MRRIIIGLVICLLLLSSYTVCCFQDSGNGKHKKNQSPNADAGADIEVLTLTKVQFDSSNCSDPDGTIEKFDWDFGDSKNSNNAISAEPNPSYIYNNQGDYKVTLTVTDDDGASASDTIIVTVKNRKPSVDIGDNVTAYVFEIVHFNTNATDYDGYIRSYEWDFDADDNYDWFSVTTGTTTHFYEEPGNYKATLKVTDNSDEMTNITKNIEILEIIKVPPLADAGSDQTVPVGNVLLKGTGFDPDGSIMKYEWDFNGDGKYDWSSTSSGITSNEYTAEGVYLAELQVTDDSGLTATDSVTIIVNNSYVANKVSANIYIDWNTSFDYIINLNNSINESLLKIIITDIITDEEEEFDISSITSINQTRFKLTSKLTPLPKHSLQIQVFYYKTLIGARSLEIVNESYEFISPELDFEAAFSLDQLLEEVNRGEAELLRVKSIGELKLKHKGDLYYTSLHGTGEYYIKDESEDSESEAIINCTDLWINVTLSGDEVVTNSFSIVGYGTMTSTFEDSLELYLDIEEMRMAKENNVYKENYLYGEGTFTGDIEDPDTGLTIHMDGDVYFESELIGNDIHKNWADDEYSCMILRTNVTLDGEGGLSGVGIKIPVKTTTINTTWNVDYEQYSNSTIYYEYSYVVYTTGEEYFDSGSGYPENSPTTSEPKTHISDALHFETTRPRVLIGEDTMVLESKHGVKLSMIVEKELDVKIDNRDYACVDVRGTIIEGANGDIKLRMIRDGNFAGLTVKTDQDVRWNGERLFLKTALKYIKT